jgi:FMN phosphatase YigB (HAD superfamily)
LTKEVRYDILVIETYNQKKEDIPMLDRKKKGNICLAIDLDDTIIWNAYKYHQPMCKCAILVNGVLGTKSCHPRDLLKRYDELDRGMVKKYSFQKERTGISWVKLLNELVQERDVEIQTGSLKAAENRIMKVALEFKEGCFPLVSGARKTLEMFSKEERIYLVLLTVGDSEVQEEKIKKADVAQYFNEVIITENSKIEILKRLAQQHGNDSTWMIGNSPHSDIEAANKAGVHSVLIPQFTWDYELSENAQPDITLKEFSELKSVFLV